MIVRRSQGFPATHNLKRRIHANNMWHHPATELRAHVHASLAAQRKSLLRPATLCRCAPIRFRLCKPTALSTPQQTKPVHGRHRSASLASIRAAASSCGSPFKPGERGPRALGGAGQTFKNSGARKRLTAMTEPSTLQVVTKEIHSRLLLQGLKGQKTSVSAQRKWRILRQVCSAKLALEEGFANATQPEVGIQQAETACRTCLHTQACCYLEDLQKGFVPSCGS